MTFARSAGLEILDTRKPLQNNREIRRDFIHD